MPEIFIDEVHSQNVLQRMWEQTQIQEHCDVSLIPGDGVIQISAHRSVLCASSDYFRTMFTSKFKESTAKRVKLPNTDGETLKSLVKFCYSGRLEMREETVEKLLITADSLLLDVVVNACGNYLAKQLRPTNCLGMTQLAQRHNCDSLSKRANDFCLKHFVEVYKTDDFLNISVEHLTQLLSSDELRDSTEEHVFKSLMLWLQHDRSEREPHKDELLKFVRMPLMKPSFLFEHVQPVCTSHASLQLFVKATQWHLIPETRKTIESDFTKPRRSDERLMAITIVNNRLDILYHCPQRRKWMKWIENLEYRIDFGVAVMEDDLFIVGGFDGKTNLNTVICLSLKTMILKDVSPMGQRRSTVGVAVIKGFLYVVGGYNGTNQIPTVEKWDSKSNTWKTVAYMSVGRSCFGITVLDDKLYVVGGLVDKISVSSVECYNPRENVWTSMTAMCEARVSPLLVAANGMLYAVGGKDNGTIERYNFVTNKWTIIFKLSERKISGRLCTYLNEVIVHIACTYPVMEYNTRTNTGKVITSIKGLTNAYHTFAFSGLLLQSMFIEN